MQVKIKDNGTIRSLESPYYNYLFDRSNGMFIRYGKDTKDDPAFSPIGPEILDYEISDVCHRNCFFCYKSNLAKGNNTSFELFKHVIDRMPSIMQVAFGIGDIDGNPDLEKMFIYCRSKKIVPNITINGDRMNDKWFDTLAQYCGAVAVSHYDDDVCFRAVDSLTKRGLHQVNIHQLVSEETYEDCIRLIESIKTDKRLEKLNALVFLSLKQKGRGEGFHVLDIEKFKNIVQLCTKYDISYGADSCSANKLLSCLEDKKQSLFIEPCESGLFSSYVNSYGQFFPCSFSEGIDGINGIDLTKDFDFLNDVWYHQDVIKWREKLINNCRNCPIYKV